MFIDMAMEPVGPPGLIGPIGPAGDVKVEVGFGEPDDDSPGEGLIRMAPTKVAS